LSIGQFCSAKGNTDKARFEHLVNNEVELSRLAQTSDNCMQIKVEGLGQRKKLFNRFTRHTFLSWFKINGRYIGNINKVIS